MSTEPSASPQREFICEPITPVAGTFDVSAMVAGEPGLPMRFRWRDAEYQVARVLEKWKTTGSCRHGSGEKYVRKHWFRVELTDGTQLQIYFDRQPRAKHRWWLEFIIEERPG